MRKATYKIDFVIFGCIEIAWIGVGSGMSRRGLTNDDTSNGLLLGDEEIIRVVD